MAAPPEQTSGWIEVIGPAIVSTLAAFCAFITWYIRRSTEPEPTPTGAVVSKAIGAAFIDEGAAAAILRIDTNVAAISKVVQERAAKEHDAAMIKSAAELAAELVKHNKPTTRER